MGCSQETIIYTTVGINETPGASQVFTEECPEECSGPVTRIDQKPLFVKFGPLINRSVKVCPVSGKEYPSNILSDLLLTDQD